MVHLRSPKKLLEKEAFETQKHDGWSFIHETRVEPDGKVAANSWQDPIIAETVSIVNPEVVIGYLEDKHPGMVLPSVREYFRRDVPKGLVFSSRLRVIR